MVFFYQGDRDLGPHGPERMQARCELSYSNCSGVSLCTLTTIHHEQDTQRTRRSGVRQVSNAVFEDIGDSST